MSRRLQQLIAELKRRHVGRVALAYAAVAVAVVQGLDILVPVFGGSEWIMRVALVFALLGFPLAVALAWVYEITPQGLRRDRHVEGGESGVVARLAFLGLVIVSVAAAGLWTLRFLSPDERAASTDSALPVTPATVDADGPIRSLAVLPLDDFSLEANSELFAAGMHEALIAGLSQVPALRVVSRTSVSRYDTTDLSLPEIGRALGVDGVIEGSVTRAGDNVRITVQLIHAPSDTHVWSNTYDGDMSDVLGLQARVAAEIAAEIEAELVPGDPMHPAQAASANAAAQEAFMQGQAVASRGTPEALSAAREHFSVAVELDSTFAPAWAALAGTDVMMAMESPEVAPGSPDFERLTEAREMAHRALALDSSSTEALVAATMVEQRLGELGLTTAEDSVTFRMSMEGMPDEAWAASFSELGRRWQRIALRRRGEDRTREAQSVDRAHRLVLAGEAGDARDLLHRVVEAQPQDARAWWGLADAYVALEEYDEAAEALRALSGVDPERVSPAEADALGVAVAENGERAWWAWTLERASEARPLAPSRRAMAHAALGQADAAFEALEDALRQRDPGLFTLRSHPAWDPLRSDPRFAPFVRRVRDLPRPGRGR